MPTCDNIIGVKNILLTFRDCDTNQVIGPLVHKLANEELPRWRVYAFRQEKRPGGYVIRHHTSPTCQMNLIRDLRVPLAFYQGKAALDVQVEYENGLVYTGVSGGVEGEEVSDTHEVMLQIAFKQLSELMPPGALAQAA